MAHPAFERVAAAVDGIPNMNRVQGGKVFDHLVSTGAQQVLELGTGHGVSAAYMAAALEVNGGDGRVTTLERVAANYDPTPVDVWRRAAVSDRIVSIVRGDSSYNWWLSEQVEARSDADGNCAPLFDFCYLDGAHHFTIDGLAAILVERLLKPGGWLLLDDMNWTYAKGRSLDSDRAELSDIEMEQPHVARVFDIVVKPHPAFTEFRLDGAQWAWAHKMSGAQRRLEVVYSAPLSNRVMGRARRLLRRFR